ncbi:DciA family protein [Methylocapsa polymorpha]|uniref:DciA family protein n=1 Tax=Methylocapsa polymorpha TaxID=3080828 RepID=A0ABZ0HR15_9HYPH|nr:DciA family protein [Methylocapsa sp. RX1]
MRKQQSNKGSWSRPLADLVGAVIDPVLARQGFGQSDLILYWDDIVGERLAAMSQPIKLQWPARDRHAADASATLIVRVETGFALELQHLSGAVIERVNAHLGWRCVTRLTLKQGPVERRAAARLARSVPDPIAAKEAENLVSNIKDEGLRQALARLGAHALSRRARGD